MFIGAIIFPTATKKRLSTGLECGQQSAGDHRQGHVARALPAEAPPVPNASERYRVSGAKKGDGGGAANSGFSMGFAWLALPSAEWPAYPPLEQTAASRCLKARGRRSANSFHLQLGTDPLRLPHPLPIRSRDQ